MKSSKNSFLREKLIGWAQEVRDICQQEGDAKAVQTIEEALERYQSGHFILSVVGMAKRGKSTLINALLGRKDDRLAPTDKLPATNVATLFQWGEEPRVEVHFREGPMQVIEVEEIAEYVTEDGKGGKGGNANNFKGVNFVKVEGPYSDLLNSLTIVDLPGLGSIHDQHNQILFDYLPASDAVLLMTTARMPVNREELELLKDLKKLDIAKLFVAINKIDETEPQELAECEAHNLRELQSIGVNPRKVHKLSALLALRGDWDSGGLTEFVADLRTFIDGEKGDYMARSLVTAVVGAAGPLLQALAVSIAATGKTIQEIKADRARFAEEKETALRNGKSSEESFTRSWDGAIRLADLGLPPAESRVRKRLTTVDPLAKSLPVIFNQVVEEELGTVLTPMETTLREACEKLQADFPRVQIADDHSVRIGTGGKHDATFAKGVLGGGALVAGGIGMATAAGAAMAGAITTVSVTSPIIAGIASLCPAWLGGILGAIGTSTVAVPVAPSALLIAAGPIGWTLAGVGALAIPLTWRIARKRKREEIASRVDQQVDVVFDKLKNERLPAIKGFAQKIIGDFRSDFEHRLQAIDEALAKAGARAGQVVEDPAEKIRFDRLENLLSLPPTKLSPSKS